MEPWYFWTIIFWIKKATAPLKFILKCFPPLPLIFCKCIEKVARTLRIIVLLHFGLVAFRILFWKPRKVFICIFPDLADVTIIPQTNIIYLWRHKDNPNNSRISRIVFQRYYVGKYQICGNRRFWKIPKRLGPEIPKIRLRNCWKSWRWDQYHPETAKWIFAKSWIQDQHLPEEMKWTFVDMESIPSKTILKWSCNFWEIFISRWKFRKNTIRHFLIFLDVAPGTSRSPLNVVSDALQGLWVWRKNTPPDSFWDVPETQKIEDCETTLRKS